MEKIAGAKRTFARRRLSNSTRVIANHAAAKLILTSDDMVARINLRRRQRRNQLARVEDSVRICRTVQLVCSMHHLDGAR